jgi:hypothetical protein
LNAFNESAFFEGWRERALLSEIQTKFYNISRVLDCVGCDKCRFNGKVQMTGIGAAMKVLFQDKRKLGQEQISKLELIGLMNLLGKLSESIEIYRDFLEHEKTAVIHSLSGKYPLAVVAAIIVYRMDCGDSPKA